MMGLMSISSSDEPIMATPALKDAIAPESGPRATGSRLRASQYIARVREGLRGRAGRWVG
jgi:hypothetical protein